MSDPKGLHTNTCPCCGGRGEISSYKKMLVEYITCLVCKGKGYTVEDLDTEYGCGEAPHPKCNGAEGCDTCEEADSEKKET